LEKNWKRVVKKKPEKTWKKLNYTVGERKMMGKSLKKLMSKNYKSVCP
jgi:hypothetical protein